ncbi:MAG: hypothetical protein UT55_C0087G0010 [Candidatus Peregrinibacteria bacterium GW2011_GWE2_39_6]|nr:MAG: hypothetical protein UT36_C0001G0058 [Candidatus Peregrinibacteria bacterium GW2011_GWF2_39_17]KKR23613.1 MAG: hypothetical protein UT55_C0087G0010 [Candidatus Peregrinibacteria bacterium GW2011_GWE2_39_6]HCW32399.1 hypothetical protein [Candidatus Peregrinibacteria bacterium]
MATELNAPDIDTEPGVAQKPRREESDTVDQAVDDAWNKLQAARAKREADEKACQGVDPFSPRGMDF